MFGRQKKKQLPYAIARVPNIMSAVALAVIGKNNEPIFLKDFAGDDSTGDNEPELFGLPERTERKLDCTLRQQFILHAALDRFEQLAGPPPGFGWRIAGVTGHDAMFVGLLLPVEDMRVYGTNALLIVLLCCFFCRARQVALVVLFKLDKI
jgi:Sedlin, N-terminal conserved region